MLKPDPGLALGTAQLGMAYGVANATGKPDAPTAHAMVRLALEAGVRHFDTAGSYGDSEAVLGQALAVLDPDGRARVTSKLPPLADHAGRHDVLWAARRSVQRLGRPLDALLLHDEALLDAWDHGLGEALGQAVADGLVKQLGVSVYSPARAMQALTLGALRHIQVPSNVLDRRFEQAGFFQAAQARGVAVTVRSVFLQGLLLIPSPAVPDRLAHARPFVRHFQEIANAFGLSLPRAALGFAKSAWPGTRLLVGAETLAQLEQLLALAGEGLEQEAFEAFSQEFDDVPATVVNPSLWPRA